MLDTEDNLMNFMLPFSLVNLTQDRKTRSRAEIRKKKWWEDGLQNWSESQFKKRLRVNRDTFHFILGEIEDLITKETTPFKNPTSPAHSAQLVTFLELQLRLPARWFPLLPSTFRLDIRDL